MTQIIEDIEKIAYIIKNDETHECFCVSNAVRKVTIYDRQYVACFNWEDEAIFYEVAMISGKVVTSQYVNNNIDMGFKYCLHDISHGLYHRENDISLKRLYNKEANGFSDIIDGIIKNKLNTRSNAFSPGLYGLELVYGDYRIYCSYDLPKSGWRYLVNSIIYKHKPILYRLKTVSDSHVTRNYYHVSKIVEKNKNLDEHFTNILMLV